MRQELSVLSDLLHKQQNASNKIAEINAEINKKFNPPTFWQSLGKDVLFSLKVFLILFGSLMGVEIFFFIISALMFLFGMAFSSNLQGLQSAGNELFYNINIFKDMGGSLLSKFGMSKTCPPLDPDAAGQVIVINYIPYAIAGLVLVVFYIFLAVLIIKAAIDIIKLGFFATKVMNQKLKVSQRKEEYSRQLDELNYEIQSLSDQIEDKTILSRDYRNIRAADTILRYFLNNRVDTIREAVNLFHDEDFKNKLLEYNKSIYNEAKQTKRYTKALYMLTSDDNIKVDVKEETAENNIKPNESPKNAFSRIKKPNISSLPNRRPEKSESLKQRPAYAIKPAESSAAEIADNTNIFDESDEIEAEKPEKQENNDSASTSESKNIDDSDDISAIFEESAGNREK